MKDINSTPEDIAHNSHIFVSTLPKSGTWLLREILQSATGLKPYEPEISSGLPDYSNDGLISFQPGTFFSWHSILTEKTISVLRRENTKNILLMRNIYDVLLSMYNHIKHDVDAPIGKSVIGSHYFDDKTIEQSLSLMISGFTSPVLTWMGVGPLLKQIDSMLDLADEGNALLVDYQQLTTNKYKTIQRILRHVGYPISASNIREIVHHTDKDRMRSRLKEKGLDGHVTSSEVALRRDVFHPYHKEMLDLAVVVHAPRLPERLDALGYQSILYLLPEANPSKWQSLISILKGR